MLLMLDGRMPILIVHSHQPFERCELCKAIGGHGLFGRRQRLRECAGGLWSEACVAQSLGGLYAVACAENERPVPVLVLKQRAAAKIALRPPCYCVVGSNDDWFDDEPVAGLVESVVQQIVYRVLIRTRYCAPTDTAKQAERGECYS